MYNIDWNRLLSLIIALAYLLIAYVAGGGETLMKTFAFLALPMAAIWYGEALGGYTGISAGVFSMHPITRKAPGSIVAIAGWILLLSPIIASIFIELTDG